MKIHSGEVLPGSDWVSTKASIYLSPWGRSFREEDQKRVRGIAKFRTAAADLTAELETEKGEGGTKMEQKSQEGRTLRRSEARQLWEERPAPRAARGAIASLPTLTCDS